MRYRRNRIHNTKWNEVSKLLFHASERKYFRNAKQGGDIYKTMRDEYSQHDAVVTNIGSRPLLEVFNPELVKHYFAVDKHFSYPKFPFLTSPLTRVVGEGLGAT